MANISHANSDQVFEEMIKCTNDLYRKRGVAVIHKVPTEWVPIRNNAGKIVSAKVELKAVVDFMGVWHQGAIAFNAKSTVNETRWSLSNLCPDQLEFLQDYRKVNERSLQFILIGFLRLNLTFVVGLNFLESRWLDWQQGGRASISVRDFIENTPSLTLDYPLDYLAIVAQAMADNKDGFL